MASFLKGVFGKTAGNRKEKVDNSEYWHNEFRKTGSPGAADLAGLSYSDNGNLKKAIGVYLLGARKSEEKNNNYYASVLLGQALSCMEKLNIPPEKVGKVYDKYLMLSELSAEERKDRDPMGAIMSFIETGKLSKAKEIVERIIKTEAFSKNAGYLEKSMEEVERDLAGLDILHNREAFNKKAWLFMPGC